MTPSFLVDAVFCAFVLGLAAAVVLAGSARVAVGAFIALGAVVAALWARLGAPDVALAEAVIGAGLTGALLLRHIGLTGEDLVESERSGRGDGRDGDQP